MGGTKYTIGGSKEDRATLQWCIMKGQEARHGQ